MSSVPLVLASGPGAESRMVIGVVVFTGVIVATLLTLFIVPAAYSALARNTQSPEFLQQKLNQQEAEKPLKRNISKSVERCCTLQQRFSPFLALSNL